MPLLSSFPVMRCVVLSTFLSGVAIFPVVNVFAAEPLVLSNASSSKPVARDRGLYWDVQQSDGIVAVLGDKPVIQCTATKHIAPRLQLKLTGGNFAVTQVEVMSERLNLPQVKTVPVMLSFNRGVGDVRATAAVLSSSRLVIALPDPKLAYDHFGQATAMRIAVELGDDVRTAMYDLTGLKTALADMEACVVTPAAVPVPDDVKHASPPPVPLRTPAALLEAEKEQLAVQKDYQGNRSDQTKSPDRPDVTVGMQGIPALAWPELDPPTLRIRQVPSAVSPSINPSGASAVVDSSTASTPVAATVALAAMPQPILASNASVLDRSTIVDDVYSPARARAQQQRAPENVVMPVGMSDSSAPVIGDSRNQLVVSGPAPVIAPQSVDTTSPSIIWRNGTTRFDVRTVETYRARAGEHLRDVLRRWADRGGIDLVWNMPTDLVLDKDFSYVGGFKDALKGLVSAYPQSGINTRFMDEGMPFERQPFVDEGRAPSAPVAALPGPALDDFTPTLPPASREARQVYAPISIPQPVVSAPAPVAASNPPPSSGPIIPRRAGVVVPPPVTDIPVAPVFNDPPRVLPSLAAPRDVAAPVLPASPPVAIGPVKRWRALSGASMRQVIQAWAEEAQVNVIWMSPRDYAVRYSVNGSTDFGRAVADLMAQYARDPVRPQGQLFNDPNGDRTLVVR